MPVGICLAWLSELFKAALHDQVIFGGFVVASETISLRSHYFFMMMIFF